MIINDKYKVDSILSEGSFGIVAKGFKIKDNKKVIIKFDNSEFKLIKHESFILNYLNSKSINGIPSIMYYGIFQDNPCLIMPFFDCNLNHLISNNELTDKQSFLIIKEIFKIVNDIHEHFVIHRDIKPDNIMFSNNTIKIIDFGLSVFYIDSNGDHINNNNLDSIIGSFNYSSCFVHDLNTPSRRDDFLSIFYILIYLLFKDLPWNSNSDNPIFRKSKPYINELFSQHYLHSYLQYLSYYIFLSNFNSSPPLQSILDSIDNCILNIKTT